VGIRWFSGWSLLLFAIVAVGLGLRLGYLFGWQNPGHQQGDTYYYHQGANLFAAGRGFPNPFEWKNHFYREDAQHPPLTIFLLAIPSVLGLTSYLDHQIFSCLLGTLTIAVVGVVGRRLAGPRAGIIAAVLAAVYPGFWLNDPMVLSETPTILVCSLLLLAAHEFTRRRRPRDAVVLGVCLGAAILVRAELVLLVVALLVPVVALARAVPWRRRLGLLGAAGAACVIVLAPWVAYNQTRFAETEFISSGLGSTLAVANCDQTYHGDFLGWWDYSCGERARRNLDFSRQDLVYRHEAETYIGHHVSALPRVVAARIGRVWGVYRPGQQMRFDRIEYRQITFNRIGLGMLWVFEALSVLGVVVLRRRRVSVVGILALPIVVTVSAAAIYGTTRFRAATEPALVLLSAVAIEAIVADVARRRAARARPEPADSEPSETEPTGPETGDGDAREPVGPPAVSPGTG
jgi:4-amino-4-deoxy-L-arabinose transferase-like glycosyltransferase